MDSQNSDNVASRAPRRVGNPWRQRAIEVQPTDYYLELIKAARNGGGGGVGGKHGSELAKEGQGYGDKVRQRAHDVEATQRKQEGERQERGYAVLQRVQRRALQAAPSRSASCDV